MRLGEEEVDVFVGDARHQQLLRLTLRARERALVERGARDGETYPCRARASSPLRAERGRVLAAQGDALG